MALTSRAGLCYAGSCRVDKERPLMIEERQTGPISEHRCVLETFQLSVISCHLCFVGQDFTPLLLAISVAHPIFEIPTVHYWIIFHQHPASGTMRHPPQNNNNFLCFILEHAPAIVNGWGIGAVMTLAVRRMWYRATYCPGCALRHATL